MHVIVHVDVVMISKWLSPVLQDLLGYRMAETGNVFTWVDGFSCLDDFPLR